ncbi:hypothetical protein KI387_042553, partial [Taxus chinensis]
IRKQAYITGHTMPKANLDVLDKLIATRHDLAQGDLGCMYLDLYVRKDKYPGVSTPCSCIGLQFPSSSKIISGLLNLWEVETLFHEFGHAIHSLLSRMDYQHFSGTRTVLDFAETPANLFEYFAWDHRVLKQFAKHYSTGDVIPEELVLSMNKERKMFAATDLQHQ